MCIKSAAGQLSTHHSQGSQGMSLPGVSAEQATKSSMLQWVKARVLQCLCQDFCNNSNRVSHMTRTAVAGSSMYTASITNKAALDARQRQCQQEYDQAVSIAADAFSKQETSWRIVRFPPPANSASYCHPVNDAY